MIKAAEDMEKLIVDQSGELQKISGQLVTQTELGNEYSSKVLEVETELRLQALTLKEAQKELDTEKAVSSKFYDEVRYSLSGIVLIVPLLCCYSLGLFGVHSHLQPTKPAVSVVTFFFFCIQILSRRRDFCKLQAAHMKLLKEVQQQKSELAEHDQILNQQQTVSEEWQLQETRLHATISQQKKLINYLHGVGVSPESKGNTALGKIRKVVPSPMVM